MAKKKIATKSKSVVTKANKSHKYLPALLVLLAAVLIFFMLIVTAQRASTDKAVSPNAPESKAQAAPKTKRTCPKDQVEDKHGKCVTPAATPALPGRIKEPINTGTTKPVVTGRITIPDTNTGTPAPVNTSRTNTTKTLQEVNK